NKQRLLKFLITLNKKDLNVPILNLSMKKSPHKEGFNY
ncbi:adenylosuccinate synthetase, partial [Bacillus sp. NRRL B-14911]